MTEIPAPVRLLAETPNAYVPPWPGSERIDDERFVIWFGPAMYPGLTVVQRVRADDATVADVRAILAERGRTRAIWMVGPSSQPSDLVERLVEQGLRPDTDPVLHILVLATEPQAVDGVTVRRVASFEDFERFFAIQAEAFGTERDVSDGGRAHLEQVWDAERDCPHLTTYLAELDGELVATARATFADAGVVLNSGATLPAARGRGTYRALVRARWDDAVERGTPFLTTLARPTSDPILRRLGFDHLGDVQLLVDTLGP